MNISQFLNRVEDAEDGQQAQFFYRRDDDSGFLTLEDGSRIVIQIGGNMSDISLGGIQTVTEIAGSDKLVAVINPDSTPEDALISVEDLRRSLGAEGSEPSVVPGPSSGAGATATVDGNDSAGVVTLITGTGPDVIGPLFTVTFEVPYDSPPSVTFSPANSLAGKHTTFAPLNLFASSTEASFAIEQGEESVGPPESSEFKYNYRVN